MSDVNEFITKYKVKQTNQKLIKNDIENDLKYKREREREQLCDNERKRFKKKDKRVKI